MRRIISLSLIFGGVLLLSSCYDPHAQGSAIVREVEAQGAGNLNSYTLQGLVVWFSPRPQLAKKIDTECGPLWMKGDANWVTTSEGTVCHAARVSAPPPEFQADDRKW